MIVRTFSSLRGYTKRRLAPERSGRTAGSCLCLPVTGSSTGTSAPIRGLRSPSRAAGTSLNAPGNSQTADQVKPEVEKLGGIGRNVAFFDPLAFRAVTDARYGNSGRNILRGPGVINTDVSLFRAFPIRERMQLQFRAEAFNASNTPHFNNPGANVSNMRLSSTGTITDLGNFMSVTSARADERVFRFALRLQF